MQLRSPKLAAEFAECVHGGLKFRAVADENANVWFLIPLWFRESVLRVIHFLDDFKICIVPVEAHLVDRVVCPAAVVEFGWEQDDVLCRERAVRAVGDVLLVEGFAPLPVLEEEAVDVLVQFS